MLSLFDQLLARICLNADKSTTQNQDHGNRAERKKPLSHLTTSKSPNRIELIT